VLFYFIIIGFHVLENSMRQRRYIPNLGYTDYNRCRISLKFRNRVLFRAELENKKRITAVLSRRASAIFQSDGKDVGSSVIWCCFGVPAAAAEAASIPSRRSSTQHACPVPLVRYRRGLDASPTAVDSHSLGGVQIDKSR
jgi:hypothetical protein